MEEDGDETRLEIWVLDILRTPKESYANHDQLLTLCRYYNMWHKAGNEFEVVDDVFQEILR
jgi:hypothetical protein